jgi:hypothetical protein
LYRESSIAIGGKFPLMAQNPGLVISGALHELVEAQSKAVGKICITIHKKLYLTETLYFFKSRLGPITNYCLLELYYSLQYILFSDKGQQ